MKIYNPRQDIFSIISLPSTTAWTEAKTEELTDYFEQFVNHIRKSAYSMSEDKYIGFNLACDNIIQQLNLSYIDYDIKSSHSTLFVSDLHVGSYNCNKDDENKK